MRRSCSLPLGLPSRRSSSATSKQQHRVVADLAVRSSHSAFFGSLQARGFNLDFRLGAAPSRCLRAPDAASSLPPLRARRRLRSGCPRSDPRLLSPETPNTSQFSHACRREEQPQIRNPLAAAAAAAASMASFNSNSGAATGDDLDSLLDSALDDFTSLDLAATPKSSGEASASASGDARPVKGLGMELPDPRAPRRRAAKQPAPAPPRGLYASEALEKLTRETREAVRGLETATEGISGLDDGAMMEEFMKQFEEFAGAQDMDSIVETMMQQLLSKEILHEPMKDIVEKYPKWLEDNKDKISKEEYERFNHQLELMMKLNEVYENEPENMSKIFEIMQNMQECGQPPSDLVQDIVPDLDLSKLGQLSPEMLESAPNCCVM